MKCKLVIALLLLSTSTQAKELFGSDVNPWFGSQTITNGEDAFQIGFTFEWSHVALDISHGIKRMEWRTRSEPEWKMDEWQSGTIVSVRGYPFNTQKFRPLLIWSHSSDVTRGRPFNDKEEPTSDFFGAGLTIVWRLIELDFAYGSYGRECKFTDCASGARSGEARISFRGYFWK